MTVAAVDPGREKCGVAVLSDNGDIIDRKIVASERLTDEVKKFAERFSPDVLLIGNGTTGKSTLKRITEALPALSVIAADEYRTTDEARREYWNANPPKGWRRFFPKSMQTPPEPVDDFAAVVIARRYLADKRQGG